MLLNFIFSILFTSHSLRPLLGQGREAVFSLVVEVCNVWTS